MILNYNNKTVFALSDTHGRHREVIVPDGVDIIIHAGDICEGGDESQIKDFFDWFSGLDIPHKIFVAGTTTYHLSYILKRLYRSFLQMLFF